MDEFINLYYYNYCNRSVKEGKTHILKDVGRVGAENTHDSVGRGPSVVGVGRPRGPNLGTGSERHGENSRLD